MTDKKQQKPLREQPEVARVITGHLHNARSTAQAVDTIDHLIVALRAGNRMPEWERELLAGALERIPKDDTVKFLYGPKSLRGRDRKDELDQMILYIIIEDQYQKAGQYTSGKKTGAYERACEILKNDPLPMGRSEENMHKFRLAFKKRMAKDESLSQAVRYLWAATKEKKLGK